MGYRYITALIKRKRVVWLIRYNKQWMMDEEKPDAFDALAKMKVEVLEYQ